MAHAPTAGTAAGEPKYYVPHGTTWPIMGSIGLFTLFIGVSILLNGGSGTICLLYTSDAADEEDSVDLRCRRRG